MARLKWLHIPLESDAQWGLLAVISSWVMVILLDRAGAYRMSGGLLRLRETASVLEATFFALLVIVPSVLLFRMPDVLSMVLLESLIVGLGLIVQKQLFHNILAGLRGTAMDCRRVLIYGSGPSARLLFSALARSPKLGLSPIAMVDDSDGSKVHTQGTGGAPVLQTEFNSSLVKQYGADMVVISSPTSSKEHLQEVVGHATTAGATVAFGAESTSLEHSEFDYIELDGQFVYGEHRVRTPWLYAVLSRTVDVVGSAFLMLLAIVPLILATLAIRLESPGPMLFRQMRAGRNGVPFTIFKFRTMHERSCGDSVSPTNSTDPRITRVGKWLRRTSLDELPQLFNVLRGDMALVGPRPEMLFIVADYTEHQRKRLSVKPGLTGIWQISADRRYPIHQNLHYDLYYLKHRSLSIDVAVLLHTAIFAIRGS